MPMDYFVWVLVGTHRSFVVDCGFTAAISAQRKHTYLRDPVEALNLLGIRPDEVTEVILTHLHYAGNSCPVRSNPRGAARPHR
jgi:glyoxylase-like metal-dependent hydrolase (beta-lactamase superfamily II)